MKRRSFHAVPLQTGLTLVELMISMVLGLLVMTAATGLLLSAKSGYVTQSDDDLIRDSGRYAVRTMARAVRQASYESWDAATAPAMASASFGPSIYGLDAHRPKGGGDSPGIDSAIPNPVNGSDLLAIRFFGTADGAMLNCAGFSVDPATPPANADESRGWSIFYVAKDATGTPQLYCRYRGKNKWQAQSIAGGVESFQVLYGLDSDDDGLPNRFVNAAAINALDALLELDGATPAEKAIDRNRKTHWKKVMVVKLALLVRGNHAARSDTLTAEYDLFGEDYADAGAEADVGTRIKETGMPQAVRNRLRKIFSATVQLRNQPIGSAA